MKWFKKKEKENDYDDALVKLNLRCDKLDDNRVRLAEKLTERLEELERIVTYARDDKPTCHNSVEFVNGYIPIRITRLYIDKHEYSVELKELKSDELDSKYCVLNVEDNIAYLNTEFHTFAIDYKAGKYICVNKETEEKKEKADE